jgi:tetratricopeptide (TPR) repeat protein
MGRVYAKLKDYNKALQYFQTAIDYSPKDKYAYSNLADLYGELGDKEKQISYNKKAAQLGKKSARKWLRNNAYNEDENNQDVVTNINISNTK